MDKSNFDRVFLKGEPFLTAYDARMLQIRRKRIFKNVFMHILREINKRIEKTCKQSMYQDSIRVFIPLRLFGYPIYSPQEARKYCAKQLTKAGYTVTWPENTTQVMIISWPKTQMDPNA